MATYATLAGEKFSQNLIKNFYNESIYSQITNQKYEGELTEVGDRVNLMNFAKISWGAWNGDDFTFDALSENTAQLVADQTVIYKIKIGDLQRLKSWVKNPERSFIPDAAKALKEDVDGFVLGKYDDVAAGNRVGTSYTTGTVAIAATTGVVTGDGTTFTAAMVGRGFKAAGHSKWYRVKTYTSATSIIIEDDLDDVASAYTGGAISAAAAYEIEAASAVTVTNATIFTNIVKLQTILDNNKVPKSERWLVLPPTVANLIETSTEVKVSGLPNDVWRALVAKGFFGEYAGFQLYKSTEVSGDNSTGYHCLAGHKAWQAFGMAMNKSEVTRLENNFGYGYKGLAVYGSKVADPMRIAAAELYCKV